MMKPRFHCWRLFVLLCLGICGCQTELAPGSLIEGHRVLGARVEVDGDTQTATPEPGTDFSIRWLTAHSRGAPPNLSWVYGVCIAQPVRTGQQICTEQPYLILEGSGLWAQWPISAPGEDVLAGESTLLVLGIICANGEPVFDLDPSKIDCVGEDSEAQRLSLQIALDEPNEHPEIEDQLFQIDGRAWRAPTQELQPFAECPEMAESMNIPTVDAGENVLVSLTVDESLREPVEDTREALLLSHFATLGKLDRQFSRVEAEEQGGSQMQVFWKSPKADELDGQARLVQFFFVVRDLRGGVDWATRTVCVR